MQLFADRFLIDGSDTIDLATGDLVRLSAEAARDRPTTQARTTLCDRLASVRHPLLIPLLDYGVAQEHWFEAHMLLPALHMHHDEARRTALHLGRFLSGTGIDMTRDAVDRNVRSVRQPAGRSLPSVRPLGLRLVERSSLEQIQVLLEAGGPPGVARVEVSGARGSGLRTTRLRVARAARLAGLVPVDSRLVVRLEDVEAICRGRHLCVIGWSDEEDRDPPRLLATAAAEGTGRHVWLPFRRTSGAPTVVALEPLTALQLSGMIFADAQLGPDLEEVRAAALASDGLPGRLVDRLSSPRGARLLTCVHEMAPEYVVRRQEPLPTIPARPATADGGVARLERVVAAARMLAARGRHARAERLLRRAAESLAARGALRSAATAACDLGELQLDRCRPDAALDSFGRARGWCADAAIITRSLTGSGRALLDQGRLLEAEGALRTAVEIEDRPQSRLLLAETLAVRGDYDAAHDLLTAKTGALSSEALAFASEIVRHQGDLGAAGRLAAHALATAGEDPAAECSGNLASMHVQAALRNRGEVERHSKAAAQAARRARAPQLALLAAAESFGCLAACGTTGSKVRRERVLAAARRLPLLRQAQVRAAICGIDAEVRRVASRIGALSLVAANGHHPSLVDELEKLLHITHDSPDEGSALRSVAEHLLERLGACSICIRVAESRRQVAAAGRPWPNDRSVTERALDAGASVLCDGATPEAAEPIRAAGATLGCIAARWVTGARPAATRITESLRLAAAATGPLLRAFAAAAPQPPGPHPDDLLGPGPAAESVRDAIRRAAMSPFPVLVEGESGAGKEIVARAIHTRSLRRGRKFCAVNCAALADDLLEAELFGHTRGAFTGALVERQGLFEEADQGTLFLDEVGELSPRAQAKLLRVLQEGEVRRIGENHSRRVDARLVAATNRSLQAEVDAGRFRADLRFRVDVIRIRIPPLRERPDEVPWLANTLWADAARRVGTKATLSPDVISALARYDWPGNVRELQNVIASLAVHAPQRGRVTPALLPGHVAGVAGRAATSFDEARLEFERRFVRAALARAGGRKAIAARQLGVSRQGLAKMMKRLNIAD